MWKKCDSKIVNKIEHEYVKVYYDSAVLSLLAW